MKGILLFILLTTGIVTVGFSQDSEPVAGPDPKTAFIRSLILPGWGHHYLDSGDWARGQYHLAAEAALVISLVGLSMHSHTIRQNWYTYARSVAGVDVEGRDRGFQLAVGDFDNLQEYNEYQERTRNWDQLYEEVPEYRWSWPSTEDRNRYRHLRDRFERIDRQLPALVGMMVVNRLISGLSAYNRAREIGNSSGQTTLSVSPYHRGEGVVARLKIGF